AINGSSRASAADGPAATQTPSDDADGERGDGERARTMTEAMTTGDSGVHDVGVGLPRGEVAHGAVVPRRIEEPPHEVVLDDRGLLLAVEGVEIAAFGVEFGFRTVAVVGIGVAVIVAVGHLAVD